jgi:hypothetical protein
MISAFSAVSVAGALLVTILALSTAAGAESKVEPQRFATVEHDGVVIFDVPSEWEPITKQRGRWPSRTIIMTDAGNIVFSVLWNKGLNPEFNSTQQLRESLASAAVKNLGGELDEFSEPESLTGVEMNGFFYSRSSPPLEEGEGLGPDDYNNFTLGIFAVGEFQIFFTMISREDDALDRLRGLEMFRGARFEAGAATEAAAPPAQDS